MDLGFGPPRLGPIDTKATARRIELGDLAFDHDTNSHWALGYRPLAGAIAPRVLRLGSSGGTVETAALPTIESKPAIAFRSAATRAGGFVVAYGGPGLLFERISARRFDHSPAALTMAYGLNCSNTAISANEPYAGRSTFAVTVDNVNTASVSFLIGFQSANISLAPLGLPCNLLIDPTNVIPVGDRPVLIADCYVQGIMLEQAGLRATAGLEVRVR